MKKKAEVKEKPYRETLGNHMSNAIYFGWINLEAIHSRLMKQLEECERVMVLQRENEEFHRRWNPSQTFTHLILNPDKCKCAICSPYKRPIKLPEDDYKKA